MTTAAPASLTACDREPIHIPGSIQPHGWLLICEPPEWTIVSASANAAARLGFADADLVGRSLRDFAPADVVHDLGNALQGAAVAQGVERLLARSFGAGGALHDLAIHALGERRAIVEGEAAEGPSRPPDASTLVRSLVGRLRREADMPRFLAACARLVRTVTGYDRVMIYRFQPDGVGIVEAEALRRGMTPYLGLHYPASDIPAQARALFRRLPVRVIAAVDYQPSPLAPAQDEHGRDFDLSLAGLRSVSPIHLEYLRNMGAQATMTVSILRGDRLWGLIACHHDAPRRLPAAVASALELFSHILSVQIDAREQAETLAELGRSREAHDALVAAWTPEQSPFDDLRRFAEQLRAVIPCDGVGLWAGGRFEGVGATPPADAMPALMRHVALSPDDRALAIDSIAVELPDAQRYAAEASGVLAIPFARATRDYLLLFRREYPHTVAWGGDPTKPVAQGDGRIGPRQSFAAWRETVRLRARPWREAERRVADMLRVALLEIFVRRADVVERERQQARDSQALLIGELNHRVKNILALVRATVSQSRGGARSLDAFADDVERRIDALAKAHDQLTQIGWRPASLRRLLEDEAQAFASGDAARVALAGPPVAIDARALQPVVLVMHEMMTNAAKYGALSVPQGRLDIAWRIDETGDLLVDWRESGGPQPAPAPARRGFGSTVIERAIPFELNGEARVDFAPQGLVGAFRIPARHIRPGEAEAPPRRASVGLAARLRGRRILLVEDNMLIALDAQAMLERADAAVEIAASVADARRLLDIGRFDAAVLDVRLNGETSLDLVTQLRARAVPHVFATGYADAADAARLKGAAMVTKPYDPGALIEALDAAIRQDTGNEP